MSDSGAIGNHHWFSLLAVKALALVLGLVTPAFADEMTRSISGLSGDVLGNAQNALDLAQQRKGEPLDAEAIRALHNSAEGEIRRAIEPFGYYRPQISAQLFPPDAGNALWRASYAVDAGGRIPIGGISIQFIGAGGDDTTLTDLASELQFGKDGALDHRHYEATKGTMLGQVRGLGYLDARYILREVQVDLATYLADIALQIDTGSRYLVGPIVFEQDRFAREYLERYVILRTGEPFSQAKLSAQRTTLSKSGHFQEVVIESGAATDAEQPEIPLNIRLVSYKPNRFRGRLGWGTDTGFGVGLDWTRRYVGSHGHRFNLGGAAVEERNRLAGDASYQIPLNPLNRHSIELVARHESKDLTYKDVDLDEGGETRISTNLASVFWHLPYGGLGNFEFQRRAGLGLVEESYDVFEVLFGNLPGYAQDELIDIIGSETYETMAPEFEAVVPSLRLRLSRADDPLYIRRGDYYNLDLLGTDESLGSNINFWQARFSSWNIWSIAGNSRVLLRTALGYTDADSRDALGVNFNQMPEYYEFRAGGARSVRGYSFETLFPSDTITGGKHQLVASIEYEREIIPNWSAAVFLDGGNAFNDFDDIDEKLGTGFGIRWRSPVGLARIDFGFPLDDADDSFQIYITVGPEF